MDRVTENWPVKPPVIRRRGQGGPMAGRRSPPGSSTEGARRVFAGVLRRCLGPRSGGFRRRTRLPVPGITGMSVLPNGRDRLAPARRMLGAPPTIWSQPGVVKARVPERPSKAHVYIDVSGSMSRLIPHLLSLILPYVFRREAEVYQFSTRVERLSFEALRQGKLRTTGGTNINCVLQHVLQYQPPVRRILVLTDGYTGRPRPDLLHEVQERSMRIHVVLSGETAHRYDLREIAASMTVLPQVWRRFDRH